MGNEANNKCHYKGTVMSALVPDVMEINVDGTGKGFTMEIWADSLDILSVSIESPSGNLFQEYRKNGCKYGVYISL